ncbi:MAG: Trk system potassium transporter TrkA [Clostridia bacterium]|nr:Trk system potassium transporter TrkA [Clostridia bacterium]
MNIIVVGCGKIGFSIVSDLINEGHDITVIDTDNSTVEEITNMYDCIGVCGNGVDCTVLENAGISQAELVVAVTASDELNMLCCFLSKEMGAKHTIARIRNPEYNGESLDFMRHKLQLSMAINPELLMAQELYNILKIPSAFQVDYFARRNLEMIEVRLKPESNLCGKKIFKIREKQKIEFIIAAVMRQGEVIIPDGSFELQAGDVISIAASPGDIQKLLKDLGLMKKQARNIMIVGGSKTAYYLAKMLLSSGNDVRIVEKNLERCRTLSELLPSDAIIIHGDGSNQELLLEEGMRSLDAFLSLTNLDEQNILTSLFVSRHDVPTVISKVNKSELYTMAESLGLDYLFSTKAITSEIVLRYTRALNNSRGSSIETLYKIMDGKAEALEFKVKENSPIISTPIKNLQIKPGVLIVGIIREGKKALIPTGDDTIQVDDRVIVLSASQKLNSLSDIIR